MSKLNLSISNFKFILLFITATFLLATNCFGVPVPVELNKTLQTANQGEIVDLGFNKIQTEDILNFSKKLVNSGGPLIYSDDPETIKEYGILYADELSSEANNRIYIYHTNGNLSKKDIKVTGILLNTGNENALITYNRKSLPAPSDKYITLGRIGVQLYYENTYLPETKIIEPGEAILLDEDLDNTVIPYTDAQHFLIGAMYDISVSNPDVKLYIFALPKSTDTLNDYFNPEFYRYAENDGHEREGTFYHSSRISEEPYQYNTSSDIKSFEIASNKKFSQADLPMEGYDALTGEERTLPGNYGVTYSIEVHCSNDNNSQKLAILVNPRGGKYGGYFQILDADTGKVVSKGFAPGNEITVDYNNQAAICAILDLKEVNNFKIEFIPAGSTFLPLALLLVPVS